MTSTHVSFSEQMRTAGWTFDAGAWHRPAAATGQHIHTGTCTVESCGPTATFQCGSVCIRAIRRGSPPTPCEGHRLPSRKRLEEYSLERKGLPAAAPRGAPIEEENTWSDK